MSGILETPGFRDAHDEVDARLYRIRGLANGLDDVMDGIDFLCSTDPRAEAVRAIVQCIKDQADAALNHHQGEWEVLKERAKAA